MFKRPATVVLLIMILLCLRADAYTVVTKNGKTLKGTLVSETTDAIIFKDEQGVQFSFKKSGLDLVKMADANKPPAPAPALAPPPKQAPKPVVVQQPQTQVVKKTARVYTDSDVMRLKGVDTTGILEPGVQDMGDPYTNVMHSAAAVCNRILDRFQSMATQATSAWEIATSTGGDGNAAMQKFIQGPTAANILHNMDADIARLNSLRGHVGGADEQGGPASEALDQAVKVVSQMRSTLATPHVVASAEEFEAPVSDLSAQLANQTSILQSVMPNGMTAPPQEQPAPPPAEDPNAH